MKQISSLPWKGLSSFELEMEKTSNLSLAFRVPAGISGKFTFIINGKEANYMLPKWVCKD
jgi:DUF1680 family protein